MNPDYRSAKMDTIEGLGLAQAHWFQWLSELSDEQAAAVLDMPQVTIFTNSSRHEPKRKDAQPVSAKERSELLGFWITWHLAGGFRRLEQWGWHRTTIHRKIRRFRDAYNGAHPDECEFNWITLQLDRTWSDSSDIYLEHLYDTHGPDWDPLEREV